jgi:hypothetical protein
MANSSRGRPQAYGIYVTFDRLKISKPIRIHSLPRTSSVIAHIYSFTKHFKCLLPNGISTLLEPGHSIFLHLTVSTCTFTPPPITKRLTASCYLRQAKHRSTESCTPRHRKCGSIPRDPDGSTWRRSQRTSKYRLVRTIRIRSGSHAQCKLGSLPRCHRKSIGWVWRVRRAIRRRGR